MHNKNNLYALNGYNRTVRLTCIRHNLKYLACVELFVQNKGVSLPINQDGYHFNWFVVMVESFTRHTEINHTTYGHKNESDAWVVT